MGMHAEEVTIPKLFEGIGQYANVSVIISPTSNSDRATGNDHF